MKPKIVATTLRLDAADYKLIKAAAHAEDRSMNNFIRLAAVERAKARDWRDDTANARPQEVLVP